MRNGAGLPAEHATCCGSFTKERQRRAHAFIRADIKVPTVYALLGHNKVRMRVQRISRLLRTHTAFFTMRISLFLPRLLLLFYTSSSPFLLSSCLSIVRSLFSASCPLFAPFRFFPPLCVSSFPFRACAFLFSPLYLLPLSRSHCSVASFVQSCLLFWGIVNDDLNFASDILMHRDLTKQ